MSGGLFEKQIAQGCMAGMSCGSCMHGMTYRTSASSKTIVFSLHSHVLQREQVLSLTLQSIDRSINER